MTPEVFQVSSIERLLFRQGTELVAIARQGGTDICVFYVRVISLS